MAADANTGFHVEALEQGSVSVVSLCGELDVSVKHRAHAEVEQALERRPAMLALDLRRLTFMDSSGVHLLTSAKGRCQQEGVRFSLVGGAPQVWRLLRICGLQDYFEVLTPPDEVRSTETV